MPKPSPVEISEKLDQGEITKGAALGLLLSYVRNSNEEAERLDSIKIIDQLKIVDEEFYKVFEEVMVSDLNYEIAVISAEIIIKHFFEKGVNSIRWVLEHFISPYQLAGVLRTLLHHRPDFLSSFLVEELDNVVLGHIQKVRYLHKSFFKYLKEEYNEIFESKERKEYSTEHLMNILINFETVIFISSFYHNQASDLGVEFKEGYVVELQMRHSPVGVERLCEIEGIFNFTQLEGLHFRFTFFKDLNGIENFPKLKALSLGQNELKEIKYINKLKNLEVLGLVGGKLTEIKDLNKLHKLNELSLGSNQITEIKNLDSLTNLEELYLEFNKISKIEGLESLTELKSLYLAGNEITEISGLETLKKLKVLDLSENRIKKIEGLEKLIKLEELTLDRNDIEILDNIGTLQSLNRINLSNNKISEVRGLKEISHRMMIHLEENGLSEEQIRQLEELARREKNIIFNFY